MWEGVLAIIVRENGRRELFVYDEVPMRAVNAHSR